MYSVLLVDDEQIVTEGLEMFFDWKECGFYVKATASSVARALLYLESEKVDLVITDVNMPVQNGIDLIRILKEQYPEIKTIILSGYSEFSYAQSALRLGALDYLTKPINFSALKSVLEKTKAILDKSKERKHLSKLLETTILLNFINGYPYDEEKAHAILGQDRPIVIAKLITEKEEEEEKLERRIKALFPSSIPLKTEGNTMVIIFSDVEDEDQLRMKLVDITKENAKVSIGLSSKGESFSEIRELTLEAIKAMKYQYARGISGVTSFSQVENQYIDLEKRHQSIIKEIIRILASPDTRDTIQSYFTSTLITLGGDLGYLKRFATEVLIEVNLAIKNFNLEENATQRTLSTSIMEETKAENISEINQAVNRYLEEVKRELNKRDEKIMDGDLSERVKAYINMHFAENLSLNTLADFFFVSPVYLSRAFKKKTGTNYIDYLTKVRIEKAKEYLKDFSLKVYEIPPLVGYDNTRYFNKLFKDMVGLTPGEYREHLGEQS